MKGEKRQHDEPKRRANGASPVEPGAWIPAGARLHFAARREAAWTWIRRPDDANRRQPGGGGLPVACPPLPACGRGARADQLAYLYPKRARLLEGGGIVVGEHDLPDVILEVDYTSSAQ